MKCIQKLIRDNVRSNFFLFFQVTSNFPLIYCLGFAKLNFLLIEKNKLQQVSTFTFSNSTFFSCFVRIYIRERERKCVGGNRRGKKKWVDCSFAFPFPRGASICSLLNLLFSSHFTRIRVVERDKRFFEVALFHVIPRLAIDRWFAPIRGKKTNRDDDRWSVGGWHLSCNEKLLRRVVFLLLLERWFLIC